MWCLLHNGGAFFLIGGGMGQVCDKQKIFVADLASIQVWMRCWLSLAGRHLRYDTRTVFIGLPSTLPLHCTMYDKKIIYLLKFIKGLRENKINSSQYSYHGKPQLEKPIHIHSWILHSSCSRSCCCSVCVLRRPQTHCLRTCLWAFTTLQLREKGELTTATVSTCIRLEMDSPFHWVVQKFSYYSLAQKRWFQWEVSLLVSQSWLSNCMQPAS